MQHEILQRNANTIAKLTFSNGDSCTAESSSMVAMSQGLEFETTSYKKGEGSFLKSAKRMLGGESIFLNHFQCSQDNATLYLAPTLSGDIMHHELNSEGLVVQGGSYLTHWGDVEVDMSWQGMKSLFSGEGLFWLRLHGQGNILFNSFGAIYMVELDGAQEYVVDSGHIVAFDETLDFSIDKVGQSWITSYLGGEGFVCRFSGKGRIWCQSHSQTGFGRILGPKLKPRKN